MSHLSILRFHIQSTPAAAAAATFSPRLGIVALSRQSENNDVSLEVHTPGLITSTSRGVVPHLSGDHTQASEAIRWVHVPFESFLELSPPLPTLHPGPYPTHACLAFPPKKLILTMSLRDPADDRDMPPNGNNFVSALCLRGVRKVTPDEWRDYVLAAQPDVLVALSDIPLASGSYSQKRITKSIERSASWLANILRPLPGVVHVSESPGTGSHLPNVLVHMAGGTTPAARQAFSRSLLEPLFDKEAEAIKPLNNLDQGVAGYTFDLAPLHKSLSSPSSPSSSHETTTKNGGGFEATIDLFSTPPAPSVIKQVVSLIRTSLEPLPATKPRFVHSAGSPHEILALIRDVGIDLFDARWAQRAADVGVGLDFVFPAPPTTAADSAAAPREIGHNLYDKRYSHDFSPFADTLRSCSAEQNDERPPCTCMACAPSRPSEPLKFSRLDEAPPLHTPVPYTRAYVHHLLHTHEMAAHTFLALHNLAVLDTFLAGVRRVLSEQPEVFSQEITRFERMYDEKLGVLAEARKTWTEVSLARGKGRLAREREKVKQDTPETAVELN